MTGPRVHGLETEYGISLIGVPAAEAPHPMYLANHVVRTYLESIGFGIGRWDYTAESPLIDARGFTMPRERASLDQLTDIDQGLGNAMLDNGARLYVDHAHPEYSGPEVRTARDALLWDRAGDAIMLDAAHAASAAIGHEIRLYRNNTDSKGASYGTHENYLVAREVPFERIVRDLTGFLVSRTVVVGAGRVGLGQESQAAGFQLGQRPDFFETEVALETTIRRPIINTRDEPHALRRRWRRLHVITGDANQAQVAGWLKVGTAALAVRTVEADLAPDLRPARPVEAFRAISHDPDLARTVRLQDGRQVTGIDLQQAWLDAARGLEDLGEEDHELLAAWQQVLDDLRTDWRRTADRLDWAAKRLLLESYRERDGLGWDSPKLALVDLQYADIDPARSLALKLERAGRLRTLLDPAEVTAARRTPPVDTRAWARGRIVGRFIGELLGAGWDGLTFAGERGLGVVRLELADPFGGTEEAVGQRVEAAHRPADLLDLFPTRLHG
ncbi:proteasome accessory factor A [Raineyella antarctica]|uniref:Proteasome accessory factor A n=1 Tax=Raineyella antarctica TaxID=1577474 RepID=A0A1G6HHY8_9ACTN|nr:depupylase/deamidase Dop [Raineyella antarctica]SDB93869.1 proteasome accessory factor A [Raineyella antarctica]